MFRLWDRVRAAGQAWAAPELVLDVQSAETASVSPRSNQALQELWTRVLAVEGCAVVRDRDLYVEEYGAAQLEVARMFAEENSSE
jgi:hypothetical protein